MGFVFGLVFFFNCAFLQLFATLQKLSLLASLVEPEEVFSSSFMKKAGQRTLCRTRSRAGEGWRMCSHS